MVRTAISLLILLALTAFAGAAPAKRVALVVGNSAYEKVPELANPKHDAEAMATALKRLEFEVITGIDLTREQFIDKIREFSRAIRGAELALFFYAGHGLQVKGNNYLAPVDTELLDEADLEFETVRIETIMAQMEREPRTNLIILDACRNNPLTRNLARSMGTRAAGIGNGLAPIESGIGTLIAFSTQPGNVALDGKDTNSPFTSALIGRIETPGEDFAVSLRHVRQEVIRETGGKQVPWSNSSLTGSVILKDKPLEAPKPDHTAEIAFWNSIKDGDRDSFEAYLTQFPQGVFAALARTRIASIDRRREDAEREAVQRQKETEAALEATHVQEELKRKLSEQAARKAALELQSEREAALKEAEAARAEAENARRAVEEAVKAAEASLQEIERLKKEREAAAATNKNSEPETKLASLPNTPPPVEEATPSSAQLAFEAASRAGTERAWKLFAARYGDDEKYGALARKEAAALGADLDTSATKNRSLDLGRKTRTLVQKKLAALGYEVGAADGIFGQNTRNAVLSLQADKGLEKTGEVDIGVLAALDITPPPDSDGPFGSSQRLASSNPDDLAVLGEDPATIKILKCIIGEFRSPRYIYGRFDGHTYVVIKSSFYLEISFLPRKVRECGGYMASIGSKAENDFIYRLVEDEPALFSVGRSTQVSFRIGPMIGLTKDSSGQWKWDSGEPVRYTRWERYQPSNDRGKEIYTSLFALRPGKDEMIGARADKWNDTCCSSHSYVLEFE